MISTLGYYCLLFAESMSAAFPAPADATSIIDSYWRDRLKSEGRAAYKEYLELSKRLTVVSEIRSDKVAGSKGTRPFYPATVQVRFARINDNVIRERTRTVDGSPNPPETILECDNADYHFTLRKQPSGYALVDYGAGPRKLPLTRQGGSAIEGAYHALRDALEAADGNNKSQLKAIQWEESKKLLLIVYTVPNAEDTTLNELWVDPSRHWRLMESRVETKSGVFHDTISYGNSVEGLDFPTSTRSVSTYKINRAPPDMEITTRIMSIKLTDKEPEAFRLTAFGIPEPVDMPSARNPTPRYVWFLVAACAFALVTLAFHYLARRRRRTASNMETSQ